MDQMDQQSDMLTVETTLMKGLCEQHKMLQTVIQDNLKPHKTVAPL
jgi:hypothetical protein